MGVVGDNRLGARDFATFNVFSMALILTSFDRCR